VETWLATYPNAEAGITKEDIAFMFKDAFTDETLWQRREALAKAPERGRFLLIAKDGEKVTGLCGAAILGGFNKLGLIYVLPWYQGKGIGKKLWDAIVPFLDKEKSTIVQVATYNTQAIEFYKKLGFADTGKRISDEKWRMKSGAVIPEMEMCLRATR
jgi:ribosomal protein S18 acetylase RimI-like enzyme